MPRPSLTEDQVQARIARYCQRYDVAPGPGGLPPFPTGRRETAQHREWLTVYRALQRFRERRAAAPSAPGASPKAGACPVCAGPLEPGLGVPFAPGRRRTRGALTVHPACADLARLAEPLGPRVLERLSALLWPRARSS